jgi:hypothetical protein
MKKFAFILIVVFIGLGGFSSCTSTDEKQLPKTEEDIMKDMNNSLDATNEMSIDTTSTDSVVLK